MPQIALIDNGDHWYVLVDYSKSPRHAIMNAAQWEAEFATASYASMRASQPGVVAVIAPQGIGKWLKDWSGPYVEA